MNNTTIVILFASMIFCHIADDFYLQGPLANFKQKKWWKDNYPEDKYKDDWLIALFEHAFSWTFSIHIPLFVYSCIHHLSIPCTLCVLSMLSNIIIHMLIDDLKCNKFKISLTQDQIAHFIQVIVTLLIYRHFI